MADMERTEVCGSMSWRSATHSDDSRYQWLLQGVQRNESCDEMFLDLHRQSRSIEVAIICGTNVPEIH